VSATSVTTSVQGTVKAKLWIRVTPFAVTRSVTFVWSVNWMMTGAHRSPYWAGRNGARSMLGVSVVGPS
jgi:hypothetical protein